MIGEVFISNYKSILDQRILLSRVNVFVGRTGSGKTNILEALGMAAAAHDDALDRERLLKRGVRAIEPSLTFHSSAKSKEIEIAWREKNSWKKAILVCDDSESWKDVSWYEPEYVKKINNLIRFIGDGTIEGAYPFDDEAKNMNLNAAFRASRNFRDYVICRDSGDLRPLLEDKNMPSIFAIDNLDEKLCNKESLQTIYQLAAKNNKQLFITTSNSAIVNELNLEDSERKIFLTTMTDDGQTIVKELTDITLIDF